MDVLERRWKVNQFSIGAMLEEKCLEFGDDHCTMFGLGEILWKNT
jgi:hypothetical protein